MTIEVIWSRKSSQLTLTLFIGYNKYLIKYKHFGLPNWTDGQRNTNYCCGKLKTKEKLFPYTIVRTFYCKRKKQIRKNINI